MGRREGIHMRRAARARMVPYPPPPLIDFAKDGTFARASAATWEVLAGQVQLWASGERRIVAAGIVIEGARTNICDQSQALGTTPWGITEVVLGVDTEIAPDGTLTGDTITGDNANPERIVQTQSGGPTSGLIASVWLKGADGEAHLSLGKGGTYDFDGLDIDVTTEWRRYVETQKGTLSSPWLSILPLKALGARHTDLATLQSVDAWGTQVELAAFPSSYIPTTTVPVTRVVDNLQVAAADLPAEFLTGDFEISYWPEYDSTDAPSAILVYSEFVSGADQIVIRSTGNVGIREDSGPEQAVTGVTYSAGDKITMQVRRSDQTLSVFVNESPAGTGSVALANGLGHSFANPCGFGSRDGAAPVFGVLSNVTALPIVAAGGNILLENGVDALLTEASDNLVQE